MIRITLDSRSLGIYGDRVGLGTINRPANIEEALNTAIENNNREEVGRDYIEKIPQKKKSKRKSIRIRRREKTVVEPKEFWLWTSLLKMNRCTK